MLVQASSSGILLQSGCNEKGTHNLVSGYSFMPNEQMGYLNGGSCDKVQVKELEVFHLMHDSFKPL